MQIVSVLLILLVPFFLIATLSYWRAFQLRKSGRLKGATLIINAVTIASLLPIVLLVWNTIDLLGSYSPTGCGSWWLGASEENCTMIFFVLTRTGAALIFLIGPAALVSFILSFAIFCFLKPHTTSSE